MRVRDAVYDESKDSCLGLFINKISPTHSPDFGIKVNTLGMDKKKDVGETSLLIPQSGLRIALYRDKQLSQPTPLRII